MEKELLSQLKLIFTIMADDEFVDSVATFSWKLYTKLKEKGFTDDQAIKIVSTMSRNGK